MRDALGKHRCTDITPVSVPMFAERVTHQWSVSMTAGQRPTYVTLDGSTRIKSRNENSRVVLRKCMHLKSITNAIFVLPIGVRHIQNTMWINIQQKCDADTILD